MDGVWPIKSPSLAYIISTLPKSRPKFRYTEVNHKDLKDIGIQKELAEDEMAWPAALKP